VDGLGAKYSVVELNEVERGYALRAELAELTGRTSVPALYVGGVRAAPMFERAAAALRADVPVPSIVGGCRPSLVAATTEAWAV
jgi:hypothetical protein